MFNVGFGGDIFRGVYSIFSYPKNLALLHVCVYWFYSSNPTSIPDTALEPTKGIIQNGISLVCDIDTYQDHEAVHHAFTDRAMSRSKRRLGEL
jgi:hypothetical protein